MDDDPHHVGVHHQLPDTQYVVGRRAPRRPSVLGIFLRATFVGQEIVIAAAPGRIIAADRGPRLINGAAALFGIEETADAAEIEIIPLRLKTKNDFFSVFNLLI